MDNFEYRNWFLIWLRVTSNSRAVYRNNCSVSRFYFNDCLRLFHSNSTWASRWKSILFSNLWNHLSLKNWAKSADIFCRDRIQTTVFWVNEQRIFRRYEYHFTRMCHGYLKTRQIKKEKKQAFAGQSGLSKDDTDGTFLIGRIYPCFFLNIQWLRMKISVEIFTHSSGRIQGAINQYFTM